MRLKVSLGMILDLIPVLKCFQRALHLTDSLKYLSINLSIFPFLTLSTLMQTTMMTRKELKVGPREIETVSSLNTHVIHEIIHIKFNKIDLDYKVLAKLHSDVHI